MKKNILALAVASAMVAPVAMAEEGKKGPDVYGQINAAISSVTDQGMKTYDRDSRLGVKGSHDLGNGLKGVYKIEMGVKVADDFSWSGRNAYVGLAGGFGTVLIGRHDTPFKMSQPKDLFGDATNGDMGKKPVAGTLGIKAGEVRADNVVAYISPEFSGVKLMIAGASAEAVEEEDQSVTNAVSAAVTYGSTKKGLYLAGAMNSWSADSQESGEAYTEVRLSAQYAANGLIGTAVYQTFDDGVDGDGTSEGSNIQLGVGYKMGNLMPKAKYSMVEYADDRDSGTAVMVGLDYKLAKATTAYVEYVNSSEELSDLTDVSVGVKHKF